MIIFNKEEKKIIEAFSDINEKNYKLKILSLIGNWKINNRNNYDYLILKEAFNWKRLAIKIIDYMKFDRELNLKLIDWLLTPHLFATFSKTKFKEVICYEKYSSHLSYFYGVSI